MSLLEHKKPAAAQLGLSLKIVDVKDVMFSEDLTKILAQVVKARKDNCSRSRVRGDAAEITKRRREGF
ncbi:hypothetical protein [Roseiflexus sp.]|uniref:hypothetical protein n=1 Tax=Roseiflexus sp. TaxID=2562120 RepID=UPI00398B24BE